MQPVIMVIIRTQQRRVQDAIRQTITVQQIQIILQQDFQQIVSRVIRLQDGSRQHLITMENISRFIPEAIMVSGVTVQTVIRTIRIIRYLVVPAATIIIRLIRTTSIQEYKDIHIPAVLVIAAIQKETVKEALIMQLQYFL